jgi:hypothetical protein
MFCMHFACFVGGDWWLLGSKQAANMQQIIGCPPAAWFLGTHQAAGASSWRPLGPTKQRVGTGKQRAGTNRQQLLPSSQL